MDQKARSQLSFDWTVPQSSSPSFHSLHGIELELAMVRFALEHFRGFLTTAFTLFKP